MIEEIRRKKSEACTKGKIYLRLMWGSKKKGSADKWVYEAAAVFIVLIVALALAKPAVTTLFTNMTTWLSTNWAKIFTPAS